MRKKTLLVATRNKNKLREVKRALKNLPLKIIDLSTAGIDHKVEETGKNYVENAKKKAKEYGDLSGISTLAEDSGLEVEALGGKPGPLSARLVDGTDEDRYKELLKHLINIPLKGRGAKYICVAAFYHPQEKQIRIFKGSCSGYISSRPIGKQGFGYDPIFYYPKKEKTFAEMTMGEKEEYGHRGIALRKVAKFLKMKTKG